MLESNIIWLISLRLVRRTINIFIYFASRSLSGFFEDKFLHRHFALVADEGGSEFVCDASYFAPEKRKKRSYQSYSASHITRRPWPVGLLATRTGLNNVSECAGCHDSKSRFSARTCWCVVLSSL